MANNIDLDALAQEFNIEINEALADTEIPLDELEATEMSDPDKVLSTNIKKANAILDRIIQEINRRGMEARLGEVAGQLINNINQAANQIYTKNFSMGDLRLKKKMVELKERLADYKEREVRIKELTAGSGKQQGGVVNQNLIITDRETALRLAREQMAQIKLLENTKKEDVEAKGENDGNE
jgi:hypothetical protein